MCAPESDRQSDDVHVFLERGLTTISGVWRRPV